MLERCARGRGTVCSHPNSHVFPHQASPRHIHTPAPPPWSRAAGSTWCWIINSHPHKLHQYKSEESSKFRLSVAVPKELFIAWKEGTQWRIECRWLGWNTDEWSESSLQLREQARSLKTLFHPHRSVAKRLRVLGLSHCFRRIYIKVVIFICRAYNHSHMTYSNDWT